MTDTADKPVINQEKQGENPPPQEGAPNEAPPKEGQPNEAPAKEEQANGGQPPKEEPPKEEPPKEEAPKEEQQPAQPQQEPQKTEEKKEDQPKETSQQNEQHQEAPEEEEEYEEEEVRKVPLGRFKAPGIEDIQNEIQEMTKKIEHEKINLRICNERREKKYVRYCELQGRPVPLTKEEKEKERKKEAKARKKHKVADPIPKKQTKDAQMQDVHVKTVKALNKNETEVETLTNEINELVLENESFKQEIKDLRKEKNICLDQKKRAIQDNKKKREMIKELQERNKSSRGQIKHKELKQSVDVGTSQQKEFFQSRDELEAEYHKIIEENIRREREAKKEAAKKRQMLSMAADKKAGFKGANQIELEKQIKAMEAEEISDRTPISEKLLEKWIYINKVKKYMIDKYEKNASDVRKAFEKVLLYCGLDDYSDLPIVYEKTEEQMANIEMFVTNLTNEVDDLVVEKQTLENKIDFLKNRVKEEDEDKVAFLAEKKKKIDDLQKDITQVETEILQMKNLFIKLQPPTDDYLEKLNGTYLADYVHDKIQIARELPYNERSIPKFMANVQDYYKLIQMYENAMEQKKKAPLMIEAENLRKSIILQLESFEKNKPMNRQLCKSMRMDMKGGMERDDIIKKSSAFVCNECENPRPKVAKKKKAKVAVSTNF